jgi:acyl carrier protein
VNDAEIVQRIAKIVSTISEKDEALIKADTDLRDALGIDSMMGLEIMYGVEKEFKVHLKEDDLPKMRTITGIIGLLGDKVKAAG